jgi:uncharacterized membrane protein
MNLRALAREYANGVLGIQSYRKARDELIESILTGTTKVTAHDFQAPLNLQRIEVAPDVTSIQTRSDKKPAPSQGPAVIKTDSPKSHEHVLPVHRGILVGFVAIILLLVIAVALYPFTRQKKSTPADASQITAPAAGTDPDVQHSDTLNAGEDLIKKFLRQNDWTDENLQQFTSAWRGLSTEERDTGLSSSARTELANAIYRKLEEERIMLGLGNVQNSIDKQTILVTFAQQVGINDPRIVVKDTP